MQRAPQRRWVAGQPPAADHPLPASNRNDSNKMRWIRADRWVGCPAVGLGVGGGGGGGRWCGAGPGGGGCHKGYGGVSIGTSECIYCRWLAVGGWWRLAVGGWQRLAVGVWWSLGAILNKKKVWLLQDKPCPWPVPRRTWRPSAGGCSPSSPRPPRVRSAAAAGPRRPCWR